MFRFFFSEYPAGSIDSLLRPYECPAYEIEYQKILQSEEVKRLIEPHRELLAYLTKHTGKNITTPQDVFFIYHTLQSHVSTFRQCVRVKSYVKEF